MAAKQANICYDGNGRGSSTTVQELGQQSRHIPFPTNPPPPNTPRHPPFPLIPPSTPSLQSTSPSLSGNKIVLHIFRECIQNLRPNLGGQHNNGAVWGGTTPQSRMGKRRPSVFCRLAGIAFLLFWCRLRALRSKAVAALGWDGRMLLLRSKAKGAHFTDFRPQKGQLPEEVAYWTFHFRPQKGQLPEEVAYWIFHV